GLDSLRPRSCDHIGFLQHRLGRAAEGETVTARRREIHELRVFHRGCYLLTAIPDSSTRRTPGIRIALPWARAGWLSAVWLTASRLPNVGLAATNCTSAARVTTSAR